MANASDRVVRAMTDDGSFRVITIRSTDTAQAAIRAQKAAGVTAQRFGELVTGAVLVRETMAPDLRVQVVMKGASSRGTLVADAQPGGLTRGLVQSEGRDFVLGDDSMLQVVRSLAQGQLHQGVVLAQAAGGVSGALTSYMLSSEQIVTAVGVSCLIDGTDRVRAAGGYIVQILPEVSAEPLRAMTQRLEGLRSVDQMVEDGGADPDKILGELLDGVAFTRVNDSGVHFGCPCDGARVLGALATLGAEEIRRIVDAEEVLDVGCDYCGKRYPIQPAQLRGLLDAS
jgi:molecular chaperone Hsp33